MLIIPKYNQLLIGQVLSTELSTDYWAKYCPWTKYYALNQVMTTELCIVLWTKYYPLS